MKRALPITLVIALLFAVPALSQGDEKDLATRVQQLEKQVEAQQKLQKDQAKDREDRHAELIKALADAEKKGYMFPAPNVDAKKALFAGLRALAAPPPKTGKTKK